MASPDVAARLYWVTCLLGHFNREGTVTQHCFSSLSRSPLSLFLVSRFFSLSFLFVPVFWSSMTRLLVFSLRFFSWCLLAIDVALWNFGSLPVDLWIFYDFLFIVINNITDMFWILSTPIYFSRFFVLHVEAHPIWIEDEQCPATLQILEHILGLRFFSRCVWRNIETLCCRKYWSI